MASPPTRWDSPQRSAWDPWACSRRRSPTPTPGLGASETALQRRDQEVEELKARVNQLARERSALATLKTRQLANSAEVTERRRRRWPNA